MITLSYSTMNALIQEPHTWLAKQLGLKTMTTQDFEDGKRAHRAVQDHVAGIRKMSLLESLPSFPDVEVKDFDEKMRFEIPFDDRYSVIGFIDGLNHETGEFLEIKSGANWSTSRFMNLAQWKIYSLAYPDYKKVWFVNTPKTDPSTWLPNEIIMFNADINDTHKEQAREFISSAIEVIDNIDKYMKDYKKPDYRSRYCYYIGCPWCE